MSHYILGHQGVEKVIDSHPDYPQLNPRREDPLLVLAKEQAEAAKRYRQAKGLDNQPDAQPEAIDTRTWVCSLRSEYPKMAMYRTTYADVRLSSLPDQLREQLRQLGCAEYLDALDECVSWEAQVVGSAEVGGIVGPKYGPPPRITIDDLAAKIRASDPPAVRRQRDREELQRMERQVAEKRAAEEAKVAADIAKRQAAEEAEFERIRRRNPSYVLRKVEELAKKLLGTE